MSAPRKARIAKSNGVGFIGMFPPEFARQAWACFQNVVARSRYRAATKQSSENLAGSPRPKDRPRRPYMGSSRAGLGLTSGVRTAGHRPALLRWHDLGGRCALG